MTYNFFIHNFFKIEVSDNELEYTFDIYENKNFTPMLKQKAFQNNKQIESENKKQHFSPSELNNQNLIESTRNNKNQKVVINNVSAYYESFSNRNTKQIDSQSTYKK